MGSRPGVKLEQEATAALKGVPSCFYHNSNSWTPVCDKWGVFRGLGFLVECKELTEHTRLRLDRFTPNERRNLDAFVNCGGLCLVLVRLAAGIKPRLFACVWTDIQDYEGQENRASIPMDDGKRPRFFTDVPKLQRPYGLGLAWDLTPLFEGALICHLSGEYPLNIRRALRKEGALRQEGPHGENASESSAETRIQTPGGLQVCEAGAGPERVGASPTPEREPNAAAPAAHCEGLRAVRRGRGLRQRSGKTPAGHVSVPAAQPVRVVGRSSRDTSPAHLGASNRSQ